MQERQPFDLSGLVSHSMRNGLHRGITILLIWRGKRSEDRLSAIENGASRGDGKRLQGAAIAPSWSVVGR